MSVTDQFCSDCLKTKPFIITLSIIITIATIGTLSTVGLFSTVILPPNILNIVGFIIGWSIIAGGAILSGFLAYCYLYDYCDKVNANTKSKYLMMGFGITTTVTLLIVSIGAVHFQDNYNHWVVMYDPKEPQMWFNEITHIITGQCWNVLSNEGMECINKEFIPIDIYCNNNPEHINCPIKDDKHES